MAETIKIVQGDTYSPVRFEIRDDESADEWADKDLLDLEECARVVLRIKSMAEDRIIDEVDCEFMQRFDVETDAVIDFGMVQIRNWPNTWNCEPGVYQGELETHRHDGSIQTVHNTIRFKVRPQFDQ